MLQRACRMSNHYRVKAAVLLLLLSPLIAGAITDKGIIYLDELTFDKLVNGREDVLVRFDKEYPWGDAHDMFKELATTLGEADAPLLIAGVPIANRAEYLVNPRLARRYGLDKLKDDDFPRFKLFLKGADPSKPIDYGGKLTKDEMSAWLVAHTSLFLGKKGQIEELDAAAKTLMAAKKGDRQKLLQEAQAEANSLAHKHKEHAEYYIKTMQRVVEKGEDYIPKEIQRLGKMAADNSVTPAKRAAFEWKLNVLSSFIPLVKPAQAGKTEL